MFEKLKIWQIILAIIVTIGSIAWAFEQRKANQADFLALSSQFYIRGAAQKRDIDMKTLYDFEDRWKCGPRYGNSCYNIIKDQGSCKTYRALQDNLNRSQEKLNKIQGRKN